jgi:hypothetical protein
VSAFGDFLPILHNTMVHFYISACSAKDINLLMGPYKNRSWPPHAYCLLLFFILSGLYRIHLLEKKDVVKHKIWVLLCKLCGESRCVVITSNIGRAIGQHAGKKEAGSTFVLRV